MERRFKTTTKINKINKSTTQQNDNGLSFEEMCLREEQKLAEERMRKHQQMYGPKPITFDGNYYSNEQFGSEPDSGFTFKVSVVSDMLTNKILNACGKLLVVCDELSVCW